MNLALWIVAGLMAFVFLIASATKLTLPKETLARYSAGKWVEDFSAGAVKAIGALELLAAIGLILPAVLGIAPVLVPLAATGGALLMAGAVFTRLRRREARLALVDTAYFALAGFVAWGRFFSPESFVG